MGEPALSYINSGCQQQSDCSLKGASVPGPLTAPGSEKEKGEEVKPEMAMCLHRDGTSAQCSGPKTRHSCPSKDIRKSLETFFGWYVEEGEVAPGIWLAEVRHAAKHPQCPGQSPTKAYPAQNVNGVVGEKP